ncbi:MAG: SdpI family protein [Candidatus Gracilibacteria bacterium]
MKNKLLIYKLLIVLLMILIGVYVYPILPDIVPIHWGFDGKPDNMGSKLTNVITFPIIALVLVVLFAFLPKLDPKKENYDKFGKTWEVFQFSIIGLMLYVQIITSFVTLNPEYNISRFMLFGIGTLFVILGNYMGKIRQNYFVGIKLPWTLANEENWNKTHRFGGKMFMLAGVLFILNAIFLWQVVGVFIVCISIMVFSPIVYSYRIFKNMKK